MRHTFLWGLIALLLVGNIWAWSVARGARAELRTAQTVGQKANFNVKVVNFASLFVNRVLQADREVDFETRLMLENAVRELKDAEILEQWRRFVESGSEAEAQGEVKKLLALLIAKISVDAPSPVDGGTN
jgi:hypothetical protein